MLGRWLKTNVVALLLLAVITGAGGWLRAEAASAPSRYQSVDERAYARLARNLARFGDYGDRTMRDPERWAPGAPAMFALAHEVRTRYPDDPARWDVPSAYPLQAAVGTATIPGAFALAGLIGGPVAGVLAAAGVAFYPPLITASGDLLTEPLGAFVLVWALVAVALALRRPTALRAAGAGALLGAAVLVRADLLAVPFLLVALMAVVAWRTGGWRRSAATSAAMLAGALAFLGPWSLYVSLQVDRFVPVSSGGASNLFVGTYLPGDGTMFGLKRALEDEVKQVYPAERGRSYANISQKKYINTVVRLRPERDHEAALRAAALDNIERYALGRPLDYAGMLARKADRLWLGYTVGTHGNMRSGVLAFHLTLVALGLLGLLAGLLFARGRRAPLVAVAIVLAWITAINLLLVSEPRHNLPVMPLVAVAAAGGLVAALRQRGPALMAAMRPGATLLRRS